MSDGYYDPSEVDLREQDCEKRLADLKEQLKCAQEETLRVVDRFMLAETRHRNLYKATAHAVEQTLGKALHYPYFSDDKKNFPDATAADGVCVGEHVPESIAEAAANRIKELEAQLALAEEKLALATEALEKYKSPLAASATAMMVASALFPHRLCDCGCSTEPTAWKEETFDGRTTFWVVCPCCGTATSMHPTEAEAWAEWDLMVGA